MNRPTLEDAIALARQAHAGQTDKAGAPYIEHPLRVMATLQSEDAQSEDAKIVAVLHDVIEDTPIDETELARLGYSPEVIKAILCVTKRNGESYDDFVSRAASNPIARQVKIADIEDNMNLKRLPSPTEKDEARQEKYRRALNFLRNGL